MSQWREVRIRFKAANDNLRDELCAFMEEYLADHPECVDPACEGFEVFGWIGKWNSSALEILEDEQCTAYYGFHDAVLPFFEELNKAIPGIAYEGELVRFDNGGEFCKQIRKVSSDGCAFSTKVDYWFEDDEELGGLEEPESQEKTDTLDVPLLEGKILKSGRATKKGNAFSWAFDEHGTLSIFAEEPGDVINGFDCGKCPWSSFASKIVKVQFYAGLRAKSLDGLFHSCYSLEEVSGFGLLDSSELTSMNCLFTDCEELTSVDFSGLDTSHVTDMEELLSGCMSLESVDLSQLDTSSVTNMSFMLAGCESLESIDLSPLDTSNATNMHSFLSGLSVEEIDLSPLDTSQVTDMGSLFSYCQNLKSIDLSPLDTSNVTNMSQMFNFCKSLESVDLSPLDTSKVTNMSIMFCDCVSLKSLDLSMLDLSNVTDMGMMFAGCVSLENVDLSTDAPLASPEVNSMFRGCVSLKSANLTGWDGVDLAFSFLGSEQRVGLAP